MTVSDNNHSPIERDQTGFAGDNSAPIAALQTEVMSAVRGAITNVMAGQAASIDLTGLDLDFSSAGSPAKTKPVGLEAKADQALAVPMPKPEKGDIRTSRLAMVTAATLAMAGAGFAAWMQTGPAANQPTVSAAAIYVLPAALPPAALPTVTPSPLPDLEPKLRPSKVPQAEPAITVISPPVSSPAPPPEDIAETARKMLATGRVREARSLLSAATGAPRSDVALILARAYDKNYLHDIEHADAPADSAEARRWYLRWFELASKDGSVKGNVRIDRLLRSLDDDAAVVGQKQ